MSEQTFTRKRSRRSPASPDETLAATGGPFESPKTEAIESDPKSTAGYRLALGAVIILGALIVIGMGVLVYGVTQGWGRKAAPPPAATAPSKPVNMSLAPGFRILSSETQPGRLIMHLRSETQDEIVIIDLKDGHVVAQIDAEAPK
jgi:hypothetical protein